MKDTNGERNKFDKKSRGNTGNKSFPQIPHNGRNLDCAGFGPNYYANNIQAMHKKYFHTTQLPNISFKPATTSETISILAYDSVRDFLGPEVFNSKYCSSIDKPIQTGFFIRTNEGMFVNPPRDMEGNPIRDEKILESFLKSNKKVNGIYLLDNDFGFAPYETFEMPVSDNEEFIETGLARVLEHTHEKKAKKIKKILLSIGNIKMVDTFEANSIEDYTLDLFARSFGVISLLRANYKLCIICASEFIPHDLEQKRRWQDEDHISLSKSGYAFGVKNGNR